MGHQLKQNLIQHQKFLLFQGKKHQLADIEAVSIRCVFFFSSQSLSCYRILYPAYQHGPFHAPPGRQRLGIRSAPWKS